VPRSPVDDEPVRIVSSTAQATETPQEAVEPQGRTLTLRDAIGLWRQHERPQAVAIRGMFSAILPDGLPLGQILCLAAPPGVGKTALALQMMAFALFDEPGLNAVWAMGEMTADKLAERVIAAQGGIAMESVRARTKSAIAESERIAVAIGDRMTLLPDPLYVADIDAAVEATGAKLCVVDYLQLVRGKQRNQERRQEVDGCLRDLRSMAMRRGVALVLISNLAKGVTHMERPDSIDVGKESSEIAFQVDVMLLGRELQEAAFEDTVEWQCLKNRHGPQHDHTLRFVPELQVFQFSGQG
jgi:replicative DNA helicase